MKELLNQLWKVTITLKELLAKIFCSFLLSLVIYHSRNIGCSYILPKRLQHKLQQPYRHQPQASNNRKCLTKLNYPQPSLEMHKKLKLRKLAKEDSEWTLMKVA